MDCLFCKIIAGQLPTDYLFEDEQVVAFKDIHPQAPTHILIIPKTHIEGIYEAKLEHAELLAHILLTAKTIAESTKLSENGYRLVLNSKQDGGQTVNHLHLHLLGGRQMTWPPG